MNDTLPPPSSGPRAKGAPREERLAAKLRENLRRRKAQARALGQEPSRGESDLPKPGASG